MSELDDKTLLARFARDNSDEAFAALAERHVHLVYSVALRKCGNPHAAEEITQAVFIILARKAGSLSPKTVLAGWLHHTARLTAANYLRGEIRRQNREQEAYMQSLLNENSSAETWRQIAPFLDDALARLADKDRDAIVLRFFENKTLADVGGALGTSEDAAKMRVNRALEKLRRIFSRRGVALSAAAIAGAVAVNSVQAAPSGLALTAAGAAKGTAATASVLTLTTGALNLMAWTKAMTVAAVSAAVILLLGTTAAVVAVEKYRAATLESYFADFRSVNLDDAPATLILRKTKYPNQGDWLTCGADPGPEGKIMRRSCSLAEIFQTAYNFGPQEIVLPANAPEGMFDLLDTLPDHRREALQAEIKKQFKLTMRVEAQERNVLVLKNVGGAALNLKANVLGGPNIELLPGKIKLVGYKISDPSCEDFVHTIGQLYNMPIVDETGLTNAYDIDLSWNEKLRGSVGLDDITRAMREQLGLQLFPDLRAIGVLVVEKEKTK